MKRKSILDRWQLNIRDDAGEWDKLQLRCASCNECEELSPWLANVIAYGDTIAGSVKLCDRCRKDYQSRPDLAENIMMKIKGMAVDSYKRA